MKEKLKTFSKEDIINLILNKVYKKEDYLKEIKLKLEKYNNNGVEEEDFETNQEIEQITPTLIQEKPLQSIIVNWSNQIYRYSESSTEVSDMRGNIYQATNFILMKCENYIKESKVKECLKLLLIFTNHLVHKRTSTVLTKRILNFWIKIIVDDFINEDEKKILITKFENWKSDTNSGSELITIFDALISVSQTSWTDPNLIKILNGEIDTVYSESVFTLIERIKILKQQNQTEKCVNLSMYLVQKEKFSKEISHQNLYLIALNIEEFYPLGAYICVLKSLQKKIYCSIHEGTNEFGEFQDIQDFLEFIIHISNSLDKKLKPQFVSSKEADKDIETKYNLLDAQLRREISNLISEYDRRSTFNPYFLKKQTIIKLIE
jgi:hypothetical protein